MTGRRCRTYAGVRGGDAAEATAALDSWLRPGRGERAGDAAGSDEDEEAAAELAARPVNEAGFGLEDGVLRSARCLRSLLAGLPLPLPLPLPEPAPAPLLLLLLLRSRRPFWLLLP